MHEERPPLQHAWQGAAEVKRAFRVRPNISHLLNLRSSPLAKAYTH